MAEAAFTGLKCQRCKQPVAVIEQIVVGRVLVMRCQSCGKRWTAEEPEAYAPIRTVH